MDMLGDKKMRKIIYKYYEDSGGDEMVRTAVHEARQKELHIFNGEQKHASRCESRLQQLRSVLAVVMREAQAMTN